VDTGFSGGGVLFFAVASALCAC